MRAGAKEFLTQPLKPEDVAAALQRVGSPEARQPPRQAARLHRDRRHRRHRRRRHDEPGREPGLRPGRRQEAIRSRLLDLDLCLGDADVFLDTIPDYTLIDVAQNVSRLDFTLLKRSLTKHASGLYLLPRPVQLEDARHDHARRHAARDRPAQGHVHAPDHRHVEELHRARHGRAAIRPTSAAGHAARPALPAQRRAADDVVRGHARARPRR